MLATDEFGKEKYESRIYESTWMSGQRLLHFSRTWMPQGNPKGVICLIHGLGEHIGRYHHVADFFNRNSFALAGFDLPGHGLSEGRRGHIKSYIALQNTIDQYLQRLHKQYPDTPIILWGHSMGGNLALNYVLQNPKGVSAALITSPWLRTMGPPQGILKTIVRIFAKVAPWITIDNGLSSKDLSHDENISYNQDPLVHSRISLRLLAAMIKRGQWALRNAHKLSIPLLLMHGNADKITDPRASQEFSEKAKCELELWPDLYHEMHNEPQKYKVLEFMVAWLQQHISQNSSQ
ncbi:alpha/beta fold hydrolase [candidate division KSB1 bacterium]|jgi:alpha-beta hydrolase superfamily lysophospholipase|nr:alpha/beta fold hydrolase [candidate division KSB1 bacterium]